MPAVTKYRAAAALLFLVTFAGYAATAAYDVVSLDVRSAYVASWRIAETGAPWIEGLSIPGLDHNPLRSTWVIEAANGHTVIGRSPGVVAAGLPAYLVGGSSTFGMAPGALTAALLTACTVLLVFLTLRTRLNQAAALVAASVLGFATPMWSIAANGLWPHTVTALGIAGMGWASTTRRWWLVGVFGGVVLWGRLHAALIVAVLGLYLAWRRREPRIAVTVGVVSGIFLLLVCAWSRWMYGVWDPTASYDTGVFADYAATHRFSIVNHLGMWVAGDRGILVWTPVVLVLLPALVRSWRTLPDWSRGLLWGGLAYTLLQATLNQFNGGDAFYGYRLGIEFLVCATPALVFSVPQAAPWARRLLPPLVALQAVAFLVGATRGRLFFVAGPDVWDHNAFARALHMNPVELVPLTVVAVVLAAVAHRRLERLVRPDQPVGRTPSEGRSAPTPSRMNR
jgi:alpha-1,2-mannosyltransferase